MENNKQIIFTFSILCCPDLPPKITLCLLDRGKGAVADTKDVFLLLTQPIKDAWLYCSALTHKKTLQLSQLSTDFPVRNNRNS